MAESKGAASEVAESNHAETNQLLNWLKTTHGILIVIGGILATVSTIVVGVNQFGSTASEDTKKEQDSNSSAEIFKPETFSVSAKQTTGYTYTYPKTEKAAKLEYRASGRWIAIPIETPGTMPKGEIDANGYSGWGSNPSKPCPDANLGSLAVTTEGNQCLAVGASGSFEAEPGESYKFVMNDAYDMYRDNDGEMIITLYKKAAK